MKEQAEDILSSWGWETGLKDGRKQRDDYPIKGSQTIHPQNNNNFQNNCDLTDYTEDKILQERKLSIRRKGEQKPCHNNNNNNKINNEINLRIAAAMLQVDVTPTNSIIRNAREKAQHTGI